MTSYTTSRSALLPVYIASLLYSFHYALPLYVDSSFIANAVDTKNAVGVVFAIAAFLTIIATFSLPRILKRFGNYRTTVTAIILEIILLCALAIFLTPTIVIPAFILHQVLLNVLYINLDVFLESFSDNATTGKVRGVFLTIVNTAVVIAPFFAGLLLSDHDFGKVYAVAAIFMIGMYIVIRKNFRNYQDPPYSTPPFHKTLRAITESHDLHSIIFIHFLLNFFYAWMVIYTPIYLNEQMGISMNNILTVIIPIAMIPFVVFQIFLGKLADNKIGEKEILALGFVITAVATGSLSFVTTSSITVWAIALFLTRIGASAIEVMAESYFYKQVGPGDTHLITFMRTIRGCAYIIGPLAGTFILAFLEYRFLFIILGVIMLFGIPYSLTIKDTR
jgi:MFS family permease